MRRTLGKKEISKEDTEREKINLVVTIHETRAEAEVGAETQKTRGKTLRELI